MSKKSSSLMKGIGAVMAVGGAAMAGAGMMTGKSLKRKAKKTATKAIDTVDDIINGVQGMLKM